MAEVNKKVVTDLIKETLELLRFDIITRSESLGQRASGKTYDDMVVTTDISGPEISGRLTAPGYIGVLQDGTSAGRRGEWFNDTIDQWVRDKGITASDISHEELVRRIAWSIRLHGSEIKRTGIHLDVYDTLVSQFGNKLTLRISEAYSDNLIDDLLTAFE